jgi:hypothetical protein
MELDPAAVRTPVPAPGRLPDFLIIGAMKSGTTTLRLYLDEHPQARCVKETHFFNVNYERGAGWYASLFADDGKHPALVGEKCPAYLSRPQATKRMAELLPAARLVVLLRDPVERAYSHYWHARREGWERLSFRRAIAAEDRRLAANPTGERRNYVHQSRYLPQLEHVCSLYPRDALLVMLFEDLRDDPAGTFARTCRFLGIDDSVAPPHPGTARNSFSRHRPEWLWRTMNRRRLWRFLPERVAFRLGRMMETDKGYPPMDPTMRKRIIERLAPDTLALADWLGRDLHEWKSAREMSAAR